MEQTAVKKHKEQAEQSRIDFKMVTFSLAGKDYGIDIMKVKEISKASKFTFVPNAAPFVKGVYNLRGDIISVIDLRVFFNLLNESEETAENDLENMIILRLDGHVIAVVVDTIDKVVGIASENVQPPHPLFGDINIKYISGVVENEGRLYVILDMERIFGTEEPTEAPERSERKAAPPAPAEAPKAAGKAPKAAPAASEENIDIGFIEETLVTFLSFYSSPVNREWIIRRFATWKSQRGDDVQLTNRQDAEAFIAPFSSPFSGTLWNPDYIGKVASFLPKSQKGNFNVWNPGCGGGHESYSVACMIKKALPEVHLRIIAHDNDLIRVSTAPGLVLGENPLGDPFEEFLTKSTKGRQFKKVIKDAVLFEYHDISHENTLPKLDMVVMRDTISYLSPDKQISVFTVLDDVLKPGGILLLGTNEEPVNPDAWEKVENAGVVVYKKK